jgi:hypothetical protein
VATLESWLLALTVTGLVFGTLGVIWARTASTRSGIYLGRGVFLVTILFLGASSLLAAWHRADGLAGLGLASGSLVIFMLWEGPSAARSHSKVSSLSEEA